MPKRPNTRAHLLQQRASYAVVDVTTLPMPDGGLHRCSLPERLQPGLTFTGAAVECQYHDAGWGLAADIAITVLSDKQVAWTNKAVAEASHHRAHGDYALGEQAASLLTDPVSPPRDTSNGYEYGNGRHRLCALLAAGVARVPIVYDL